MAPTRKTAAGLGTALAFLAVLQRRRKRRGADPVHAPGHTHRGPDPAGADLHDQDVARPHDQPWVRTSHSDSQRRRFRR